LKKKGALSSPSFQINDYMTLIAKMAAAQPQYVTFTMLASYDEYHTYWQNGGCKKISDVIFAEWPIFMFLIFA
jgi:hypothetical protein